MQNNKFPKINFIGNKDKLASWICDQIPKDAETFFDAFSGGVSVSYEAKKRGYEVIANDILKINYYIAKSLIENKNVKLDAKDINTIFTGKPRKGFMYANHANVHFFQEECMELDLYRENIEKLNNPYKKTLAFVLFRRAMIRKMPYSRFTIPWDKVIQLRNEEYSYSKYKRKRAYHNLSFEEHFLTNVDLYNNAVFDNKKINKVYNKDIFTLLPKIKSDVIYIDPPYAGTMNNYFGFYNPIDEFIEQKKKLPFANNFMSKKDVYDLFDKLFSSLTNFKYWLISYNNGAYPTKTQMLELLRKYSQNVKVIEKNHNYQITGKNNKQNNIELLFIVTRG